VKTSEFLTHTTVVELIVAGSIVSIVCVHEVVVCHAFSALTLLVGHHKEHQANNNAYNMHTGI